MTPAETIAVGRRVIEMEAAGLALLSAALGETFSAACDLIAGLTGRLVCAGVGKSGHVARKIAATLASTGTPAQFVHPTEASHGDMGMIGPDDALLILSKSGEVPELSDMLAYAGRFGVPIIGITARAGSPLGQASRHLLLLPEAPEACGETRAPTTSTTMQMALGDALAVAMIERKGFTATDFRVFHPGGKLGAMLRTVGDLMHKGDELPVVAPDTPMMDALLEMTAKRLGCTTVAGADGRLLGIITDGDVRRRAGQGLRTMTAGEVMTPSPMTCPPGILAAEAMARLSSSNRTVLIVTDDTGRAVGIVHVHDLLRAGVA
jgi:arabinose-5-phosphate isomerase